MGATGEASEAATPAGGQELQAARAAEGHGNRLRALLLEDDPQMTAALIAHLQRTGAFQVPMVADSAIEAIDGAARFRPAVIVVDIALAGDAGLRILSAFRDVAPHASVFVITPLPGLRPAGIASGAREVVEPSDLRPLCHLLPAALEEASVGCTCCPTTAATTVTLRATARGSSAVVDGGYEDLTSSPGTRNTNTPAS